MPTKQSKALAEQIKKMFFDAFLGHRSFDDMTDELAMRLDQHVLLEQARIARLEQAIGNMYDSQHDTPYGQE